MEPATLTSRDGGPIPLVPLKGIPPPGTFGSYPGRFLRGSSRSALPSLFLPQDSRLWCMIKASGLTGKPTRIGP